MADFKIFCQHSMYLSENVKCFKRLHRRDKLGYPHIYQKIILKLILEKCDNAKW